MGTFKQAIRRLRGKSGKYDSAQTVLDRRNEQMRQYLDRSGGLDEFGIPRGAEPPPAEFAPMLQFQAERMAFERNRRLEGDADAAVQSAQGTFESYRPGGAAALAAGIHARRADVLLASRAEAPDLLFDWRREQEFKARKAARQASYMQFAGQVVGAAATVAGAALTGGASLALTIPMMAAGAAVGAGGEYVEPGGQKLGGQQLKGGNAPAPIAKTPPGYQPVNPGVPSPGGGLGQAQAMEGGQQAPQQQPGGPQPSEGVGAGGNQQGPSAPPGGPAGGMGGPGEVPASAVGGGGGAAMPFAPTGAEIASPLHPTSMVNHIAGRYGSDAVRRLATQAYMTEFANDPWWDRFYADLDVLDTQVSQLMTS